MEEDKNIIDDKAFKEEVEELMRKKGEVRGEAINSHRDFIIFKEGKEGLKRVEERLSDLGYPVDFNKIEGYKMYPAALAILVVLVAKKEFNWPDEMTKEHGTFNLKNSFILKMFLRHFVSLDKLCEIMPKFWNKEYNFGSIEVINNEGHNEATIKVFDYDLHPINCIAFQGIAEEIIKYVVKTDEVLVEETKCIHRGDDYHEYTIRWK